MSAWWREVWCSYCGAPPGQGCVSVSGRRTSTHADRHREGAYFVFNGDYEFLDDDDYHLVLPRPSRLMKTVYLPGDGPKRVSQPTVPRD